MLLSFIDQHFVCLTSSLGAANIIMVEIVFFVVSRYENLSELHMHFELRQVGNPWTDLAEISPNCCQKGYLQSLVCEFQFSFSFQSYSLFFTGGGNDFLSPTPEYICL